MKDFVNVFFNKISDIPKKVIIVSIIVILLFTLMIFPYIDTNLFYPNRIKNRLEILDMVTKLDIEKIECNSKLKSEYDNILTEINKSNDNYINNFFKAKDKGSTIGKLISGASIWWILAIIVLFHNDKNSIQTKKQNRINKIGGFFMLVLIGAFIGLIFSIIPTIGNPWVNYLASPVLTIVILILLFYTSTKKQ